MTLTEFMIVWALCLITMLLCRCIPIFYLKGKDLPANLRDALNLIPPAAFAALVANDLFKPETYDLTSLSAAWPSIIPFVAGIVVVIVALKTHSLIWCALAGVISYALLTLI